MAVWQWSIITVFVLVMLVLLFGLLRYRFLSRQIGSFECALRRDATDTASHWSAGFGRYQSDAICWWRATSLKTRPHLIWHRSDFEVLSRVKVESSPGSDSAGEFYLVTCQVADNQFELMMAASAYHGLSSWTEAAPPSSGFLAI